VFKGNKMDAFSILLEIYVKQSSITEWAYVFTEGVRFLEHNANHSNHISRYGEVEGDDDNLSIDSQF
jgi:hypothetical protein